MSDYPEHAKLSEVSELSQAIGEFLDFGDYTLCEFVPAGNNGELRYLDREGTPTDESRPGGNTWALYERNPAYESWNDYFRPASKTINGILADYFGIDLDAIEREKKAIEVPVKLDTKALADLRLLLSQVGFAIDNYLASQESNIETVPKEGE